MNINSNECAIKEGSSYKFSYTNWKGAKSVREAIFKEFYYGKNEFHHEYQLLIKAFDLDKLEERTFAAKDIDAIEQIIV